ncbi:hypothetical protein MMC07_001761 [Pseudocyphellaria aurata]|nr:hypothetical protein [Pseudocyphellaria aurata]
MLGHLPRSEISNGLSNGPSDELCLLYENADGNVTMLIGKVVHVDPSLKTKWTWKWDDISEKLYSSLPETHFGPPFQGNNGWSPKMGNSSIIEVIGRDTTIATNQGEDPVRGRFLTSVYTSNNKTFSSRELISFRHQQLSHKTTRILTRGELDNYPNSYDQRIEQSDVALVDGPLGFGLWVEDQKLAFLYTGRMANIRLLESPFPFPRLARSFPQDRTVFYLYHQLNGSAFAEDQWDASISEWTKSTNIHISEH